MDIKDFVPLSIATKPSTLGHDHNKTTLSPNNIQRSNDTFVTESQKRLGLVSTQPHLLHTSHVSQPYRRNYYFEYTSSQTLSSLISLSARTHQPILRRASAPTVFTGPYNHNSQHHADITKTTEDNSRTAVAFGSSICCGSFRLHTKSNESTGTMQHCLLGSDTRLHIRRVPELSLLKGLSGRIGAG